MYHEIITQPFCSYNDSFFSERRFWQNEYHCARSTAVSGTVTDAITGEALAGAAVEIENTDIRVFTDLEGKFQFDQLNVGTYSIKVKYISYQDKALKELVFKQEKSNLNIQLDSK